MPHPLLHGVDERGAEGPRRAMNGHGQEDADNISTSGLLFPTGGTNGIPNVIAENIVR